MDRQSVRLPQHPHSPPAEHAGKRQLAHPLGQRQHGGQHHGRRTADEHVHAKRLARFERRRVMHTDRTLDLVMQSDFSVGLILAAGELHAVHAEVRPPPARLPGVFGVNLRQGDERAAVARPADLLRQLRDSGLVFRRGRGVDKRRHRLQRAERRPRIAPRLLERCRRVELQFQEPPHALQAVAQQVPRPVQRAEQVADHRKAAALHPGIEHGRPARRTHPAMNLRRLEPRIDLLLDPHQLPRAVQVVDAFSQRAIAHEESATEITEDTEKINKISGL